MEISRYPTELFHRAGGASQDACMFLQISLPVMGAKGGAATGTSAEETLDKADGNRTSDYEHSSNDDALVAWPIRVVVVSMTPS